MLRKIAILNFKGGTGKTTTTVNLGAGLAMIGYRVLIMDMDPQGNAGISLGIKSEKTAYHLLTTSLSARDCLAKARDNLDIIISDRMLADAGEMLVKQGAGDRVLNDKMKGEDGYNFIFVDCAPSFNLLNQNALNFVDEVFVPVSMEYLALVGVRYVIKGVNDVNRNCGHPVSISLIIPTFFDLRNSKSQKILASLTKHMQIKIADPVRINSKLSEAPNFRQTIFEYDSKSYGAVDYAKLVKLVAGETD